MTPTQVAGIKRAMRRHARILNIERYTDDLIGYALESFLKKPNRKNGHVAIDFIRSHFGRPGSKKSSGESNLVSMESVKKKTVPPSQEDPLDVWRHYLARLDQRESSVLFMSLYGGLRNREIATALQVSENRVEQILRSAREKIREKEK